MAIRARDLRKVYRLYRKPSYRFFDMFGLLPSPEGKYTEHAALNGVSLDIGRGEKVAIIGRNGAGKSTFLKLVTGVIEPTSGSIEVRGKAHALLQIGTGFHPDFTGRENVYAYLAQLGVSGAEARRLCRDIIAFSELEAYIDQPVKTYSTGMGVRLMFSTSTAISPDLLVLDEVLGVGDAYFAHKSFERMRELCEGAGTTLLLVTHDIYSAVKLCARCVWIDRGQIVMDGDGASVIRAYEDSVRQQEEQRLRLRAHARMEELQQHRQRSRASAVLVEVRARDNRPQPSPVYFSSIRLRLGDETLALPLTDVDAFDEKRGSHLLREGSAWGDLAQIETRMARPLLNYGSPFHKIAGVFAVSNYAADPLASASELTLDYWAEQTAELAVRLYTADRAVELGALPPTPGSWASHSFAMDTRQSAADVPSDVNPTGQHGSGAITATSVETLGPTGAVSHAFAHGAPFTLRIAYRVNDPTLRERAQVLIAFHRNGVEDVCRVITRELMFDGAAARQGVIILRLPRLLLGQGTYTVTVMIAEEGYYDRSQTVFYSVNPGVYDCLTRVVEINVHDGGIVGSGTAVVAEGEWALQT